MLVCFVSGAPVHLRTNSAATSRGMLTRHVRGSLRKAWPTAQLKPGKPDADGFDESELLRRDAAAFRARSATESEEPPTNTASKAKKAIDTILLWDFFLVLGLLAWLIVALVPHFASQDDRMLDAWLALWEPFIQPALGVLMLGTLVQGITGYLRDRQ